MALLQEVVNKAPSELGYEFGRWTAKRLSIYLLERTGIQLSSKQISRILQKKKYVYIWAKYSLESKQNKAERGIFREKLETYLKAGQVAPELFQVWFWDETGFSLRVIRRKCWTRPWSPAKSVRETEPRSSKYNGRVASSRPKALVLFY